MKKRQWLFLIVMFSILPVFAIQVQAQQRSPYLIPLPSSQMVPPETTIAVRPGDLIDPQSVSSELFRVEGTLSGQHSGRAILSDDQRTVIFIGT